MDSPAHAIPMQTKRRGGGTAPTLSQPGTRRKWAVSTALQSLYPRERAGNHCTGGWVGLGDGLDGTGNLALTAFRFPDCPARSEWLYALA